MSTPMPAGAQDRRARYIDGLRVLASVLEQNPELPLPYQGNGMAMTFHFLGGQDPRSDMAAAARLLPVRWRKEVVEGESASYFQLLGELSGLSVELISFRDAVCKRVVTGTREVTETVKDPAALAEVPEVEVTRTEEIVEWDCGPLLAPLPAPAAAALNAA